MTCDREARKLIFLLLIMADIVVVISRRAVCIVMVGQ